MAAKVVLWIFGLSFLAFGGWALFDPVSFSNLVQFELTSKLATTEMRAFYGGLELGLAAFFILGALKPDLTRPALLVGLLSMGTVACSRIVGIIVDGSTGSLLYAVLAIEIIGALACFLSLKPRG
ncbi:MAG: DUF4345 domain-containing protein [Pseudomonadota bacterium]